MSGPFRKVYRALTEAEQARIEAIKTTAEELLALIMHGDTVSREQSLAKTKLEECVMWATKALT